MAWCKRVIGCLLSLSVVACQPQGNAPGSAVALATSAKAVATQEPDVFSKVRGTCTIKPERVVRLKSQIGGEVKTVLVQQGAKVRRGDILATIDVENLNLRRQRTVLELEKLVQRAELLRFQVAKAEKELAVVREISNGPLANSARFGKEMATLTERRVDAKDNELNQALTKLDLKVLDDQIHRAAIRAPLDGVVLLRAVEPGAVVGSGVESVAGSEVLFEVADPGKLVASCIIRESDAALVRQGATALIMVDGVRDKAMAGTPVAGTPAAGAPVAGKVGRVSPVIANEAGLARREFLVELGAGASAHLLPGMNATVEIDQQ